MELWSMEKCHAPCRFPPMNKSDIIKKLQNETDLTKKEANIVLDTFSNEMAGDLSNQKSYHFLNVKGN